MARRYSAAEVRELEEAWDYLIAFKEFILYRLSAAGVKKFRDTNEIEGDLYDWMENKFGSMIEAYSAMRDLDFEAARTTLLDRPYIDIVPRWKRYFTGGDARPVGARRNPEEPSQFEFHLKPSGWTGAPCPICGCTARNLRARHRALKADEAREWGVPWIKRVKVAFGTDWSDEPIKG